MCCFIGCIEEALELRLLNEDTFNKQGYGLLRIAYTNDAGGGGVYINLNEKDAGRIYKASWDDKNIVFLSHHIFDFVKNIKSVLNPFYKFNYNNIYKKWGETIWKERLDKEH